MSTKTRELFFSLLCLLLLIPIASGCLKKPAVRLGFTAEISGKQSEPGVNLRNGVQLAADDINAAGGVSGRMLQLLIEDDLGTPEGARATENKLIDAGVAAVIGHYTSNQTLAGYAVAKSRGVLLLSATASTSLLSANKDLFFRTVVSTDLLGKELARYIRQKRNVSRIAIIYDLDNNTYAEPLTNAFTDIFHSLGGQVTSQVKFSNAAHPDFLPLVDQLKSSDPGSILIIASPTNTALIAQAVMLRGWSPFLFAASSAQGEALIQNGGKSVEGMEIIIGLDINQNTPALQAFKTEYEQRFAHPPIYTAIEGYETMRMLAAALQKTGGEARGLPEALIALKDFQGLTGFIRMDEFGDAVRPLYIQQVQGSKFVTVATLSPQP